jgi:hypothetical protein
MKYNPIVSDYTTDEAIKRMIKNYIEIAYDDDQRVTSIVKEYLPVFRNYHYNPNYKIYQMTSGDWENKIDRFKSADYWNVYLIKRTIIDDQMVAILLDKVKGVGLSMAEKQRIMKEGEMLRMNRVVENIPGVVAFKSAAKRSHSTKAMSRVPNDVIRKITSYLGGKTQKSRRHKF